MINKVYKTSNLIPKLLIAVTSIFCISSCGKVKNEPVKVIQTGSFSNALVIQVNKIGKYSVYIPNDTVRPKFAKLVSLKAVCGDSIWEIKLSEISNAFDAYKDITKSKDKNRSRPKCRIFAYKESNEMLARCRLYSTI